MTLQTDNIIPDSTDQTIEKYQQTEQLLQLKMLEFSDELLQVSSDKINFEKILKNVLYLSHAKYGAMNLFDENGANFKTVAVVGMNEGIMKASELLGFEILGKEWSRDIVKEKTIKDQIVNHFPSLQDLTGDILPVFLIKTLEKIFGLGEVVVIRVVKDGILLGDFTLIMSSGKKCKNENLIEIYSKQIGILITRKKAEEALKESDEHYKMLFNSMLNGYALHEMVFDNQGKACDYKFIDVNPAFEEMTGLKKSDCVGKTIKELIPETESYWIETYENVVLTGKAIKYQNYSKALKKHFEVYAFCPIKNHFATLVSDITEKKSAEDALTASYTMQKQMIANISDVIVVIDKTGHVKFISPNITRIFGWLPKDIIGTSSFNRIHPDDVEDLKSDYLQLLQEDNSVANAECRFLCKDGSYKDIELTANNLLSDPHINGVLINYQDITERKKSQEELIYNSYHDSLTGLYNRRMFEEYLNKIHTNKKVTTSIILGDINGLKLINDAFGHKHGDVLIQTIAGIIKKLCGDNGVAARVGGDEFAIILEGFTYDDSSKLVEQIKMHCREASQNEMVYSISFGVATNSEEKLDMKACYHIAEDRMYTSKLLEGKSMKSTVISNLRAVLSERTGETTQHCERMAEMSKILGEKIGLHTYEIEHSKLLCILHDIGKTAIPDGILLKEGSLDETEMAIMKKHCEIGFRIASTMPELAPISEGILHHHERWDGKGYPQGLKGEKIPKLSRIVAILDAYDAMTHDRPYRGAISKEEAIKELERNAGKQFDPNLLKTFLEKVLNQG